MQQSVRSPIDDVLLLARRKLRNGLGPLGDGVLRQLAGKDETDSCLDLARGDGRLLGVGRELCGRRGKHVDTTS